MDKGREEGGATGERIGRDFFLRPAALVARALLGKHLVSLPGGPPVAGMIVETEAYAGVKDRAFHAFGGKVTPRTKTLYLPGGHIYIYLCYGIYWQLNVTARPEGVPACVLIRALEPTSAMRGPITAATPKEELKALRRLSSGPGLLTRWLRLDRSVDGEDAVTGTRLWFEDRGVGVARGAIAAAPRIGIDYAGEWTAKPLRFYLKDNPFVSRLSSST